MSFLNLNRVKYNDSFINWGFPDNQIISKDIKYLVTQLETHCPQGYFIFLGVYLNKYQEKEKEMGKEE